MELGDDFTNLMKKKGDEKNAKKTINPEDDDWEFARIFEDITDSKKKIVRPVLGILVNL